MWPASGPADRPGDRGAGAGGRHHGSLRGGGPGALCQRLVRQPRRQAVLAPERLRPGGIDAQPLPLQGRRERGQGGGRAREQLDLPAPVLPQLLPAVRDPDEARAREDRR